MAYEMRIDAAVSGQQQVDALTAATDRQAARTKSLDDGLKAYLATHDKYIKAQETEAGRVAAIAALKEKYYDQQTAQLRKIAAAQDAAAKEEQRRVQAVVRAAEEEEKARKKAADALVKAAEAQQKANAELGASVKNFITNHLGAAGDAAEKFALNYGKVGLALVGVGTAAAVAGGYLVNLANETGKYAQETYNLAQRTGLTTAETQLFTHAAEVAGVNAGTLTTAMRTLSRGMSENSDEGKKQKQVLRDLGMGAESALKPMGELLPEIFQKLSEVGNVMERDRMTITLFGRSGLELEPLFARFKELEERVSATGDVMDSKGIDKARAYREEMALLAQTWEALTHTMGMSAIGVIQVLREGFSGGPDDLEQMQWATSPGAAYSRKTRRPARGIEPNIQDAVQRYGSSFGPITGPFNIGGGTTYRNPEDVMRDRITANQSAIERALKSKEGDQGLGEAKAKLAEAQEKLKTASPTGDISDKVAAVQAAKEEVAAIEARIKASKDLVTATERLTETQKRATEAYEKAQALESNDTPMGKFLAAIAVNATETADQIRKSPASLRSRIQSAGMVRDEAALLDFRREQAASNLKFDTENPAARLVDDLTKNMDALFKAQVEGRRNLGLGTVLDNSPIAPPPGYTSPAQQLKDARDRERRGMALIGVRAGLEGASEGDIVKAEYAARIGYARDEYAAQLRLAEQKKDDGEKERARADALDQLNEKIFDAQLGREQAILEMALKQKEQFQSLAVGFLDAARSGGGAGIQKFLIGQVNKIEDTIVGNAAGLVWPTIQKAMGGMHTQAGTTMGKLLQGTPFGPDPLKTAGMTLTQAGADLIQAAADLRAAATSPSGGGGSAGGWSGAASRVSGMSTGAGAGGGVDDGSGPDEFTPAELNQAFGETGPDAGGGFSTQGGYSASPAKGPMTVGKGIGYGVAAAGAAYGAYEGFKAGGAQGALQGTGSILGAASLIPGPQQPFIMAAAMATTLISSILGDPKQRRENEIQKELKYNQYMAPVAISASMTTGGTYADFDRFGAPRGSNLSPFPTVEQGFFDYRHNITVPGRTDSAFGGPGGTPITVSVQTLDSRSFNENSHLVADAVQHAIQTGRGTGLQETLRHL